MPIDLSFVKKPHFYGIAGIILIFSIILLVGYFEILDQQKIAEQEIHSELTTIADLKAKSISDWYHERKSDAEVSMKNQMLFGYLSNLKNPGGYDVTKASLIEWLHSMVTSYHYQGAVLLNETGDVVLTVPDDASISTYSKNVTFFKALNSIEPVFTDLFLDPDTGKRTMEFWIPIRFRASEPAIGVLVLEMNPEQYLYPLIQSWPEHTISAESLITRQVGNEILFLNDLRHVQHAGLTLQIPIEKENVPAVMAAQGVRGIVKGDDYRGVPVIASITNITGTPWFIVAKIDQDEIYTPFKQFSFFIIGLMILLIFIASLVFIAFYKIRENNYIRQELDQKQHELTLSNRIRLLMEQANDAIFILDTEWHILEVNDRAVVMYGYSPEEFQKRKLFDLRSEAAKEKIHEDLICLTQTQNIFFETEHQKKDGTIFPVEDSIRTIDIQGKTFRQVIVRDITARKAYEADLLEKNVELQTMNEEVSASYEELAAQQEELRVQMELISISEHELQEVKSRLYEAQRIAHIGTWEYDINTKTLWTTDEGFRLFGIEPTQDGFVDLNLFLNCVPQRELVLEKMTDLIEKNIPYNTEMPINPADGSPERIIVSSGKIRRDKGSNQEKIVGIIQDVTEKRKLEEDIRKTTEKISAFFHAPVLGTVLGDIHGNISTANSEFLRIIGYTEEDLLSGKIKWKTITPVDFLSLDEYAIQEAKMNGNCTPYEKQYIRSDGTRIWVLVGFVLLEPEREESVAFVLDISKQKKIEDELHVLNQNLEEKIAERTDQIKFVNEELLSEVQERVSAEKHLQEILSILSATIESTPDGLLVINNSHDVAVFNLNFKNIWNIENIEIQNISEEALFLTLSKQVINNEAFFDIIRQVEEYPDVETHDIITLKDNRIIERYSKPQHIGYTIAGRVWSFRDITERKRMEETIEKSLREKEILLKEIHHRVKNNMQVVSSLLYMQSRIATDQKIKELMVESQNRVKSIALVHEELYQSLDLERIDYSSYLRKITRNIFESYKETSSRVTLKLPINPVYITISKAVPCSLIVNELISNSLKHAFPEMRKGMISIDFTLINGSYILKYADDGIGILHVDFDMKPKTLGMELIHGLVKQLNGTITRTVENGTSYEIRFSD
ncbi:PAS domain S-box protein [Methanospirillum sp.]